MNKTAHTIIAAGNSMDHPIGTVCYEFHGHDYGAAREDTAGTRVEHISMTLQEDGEGPYFTARVASLSPQPMAPYVFAGRISSPNPR